MKYQQSLLLATDLDGTFLGGSQQQRSEFYQYIEKQRDRLLLVYVTGRELDWINNLLIENPHIPKPDYIIGDVGTTIVHGETFEPIHPIQDWIIKQWNNSKEKIKTLLANEPGLELQAVNPDYRVSYYYDSENLQPNTIQKVINAGFDCIVSSYNDIYFYFDVMPKGVSKGLTLLKFLEEINFNVDETIACGDTLNDLSLFETGLKGIAVGNSHPNLVDKIQTMDNVYHSSYPGVMGIWDGLKFYGKD